MSVSLAVAEQSFRLRRARFDACRAALARQWPEAADAPDLPRALAALGWSLALDAHGDATAADTLWHKLYHETKLLVLLGYFADEGHLLLVLESTHRRLWRFDGARARLVPDGAPEPAWDPDKARETEEENARRVLHDYDPHCPTCAGHGEPRVEMRPDAHGFDFDYAACPAFRCRACRAWSPNPLEVARIRDELRHADLHATGRRLDGI